MLGMGILIESIISFFFSFDWLNIGRTSEAFLLHTLQIWALALMACFSNEYLDDKGVHRTCPSTVTGNWVTGMTLANSLTAGFIWEQHYLGCNWVWISSEVETVLLISFLSLATTLLRFLAQSWTPKRHSVWAFPLFHCQEASFELRLRTAQEDNTLKCWKKVLEQLSFGSRRSLFCWA